MKFAFIQAKEVAYCIRALCHVLGVSVSGYSVHLAGISNSPDGAWMAQIARHLTDFTDGFLKNARHRIVDRDPLYTAQFQSILASANVELLRLPARSPNLNNYAERFVGSIQSECLRHMIPLGEQHLRSVVKE